MHLHEPLNEGIVGVDLPDDKINEIIQPLVEDGTIDQWIIKHSEEASKL